jgi:beta-glucosidase
MKKKSPARTPLYKNPAAPVASRVRDLLSRMTLEEKAAQMMCLWQEKSTKLQDARGNFDFKKAKKRFGRGRGIGQIARLSDGNSKPTDADVGSRPRETAELANAIQKFFVEHSRLGIPVFFHEECLHGHVAIGATSFSEPIGLGATFNPELVQALYTMAAEEARIRGAHQALTPVVDVAREPRWGRVEETFGEDPYLVAQLGIAAVRGFQGDASFKNHRHVIATLKHFAAHAQPESGQNCAPANVSLRVLRETFLHTFKEAVQKAGAISVMASYNEIDGVPSHASRWLLRDVLRKEWGFKGFVVSDYFAIWELGYRPDTHGHFLARDKKESCALAVKAGVNIELPDPDCYLHLVELVRKKVLQESELDDLVGPMLYWKFKMGLFENPYVDPNLAERVVGCPDNRELALQAARETITLLKNEKNLLPLNPARLKTIAVIGPNAAREMLGGYSGTPDHVVTVLEGIRARVGGKLKVTYAEGCKITLGGTWNRDEVVPADEKEDRRLMAAAVRVASKANAIVLCIGGNEQISREAWSLKHMGDRSTLDLIGRQSELVRLLLAVGKPLVVVLFNGSPLSINEISEKVPAVLECWYPGQEGGHAVAEVLFGDYNPGGKLPITIPRSAGHLPSYYNYKPSARRGFLFDDVSPLYPFGFGLSYTSFVFKNLRLEKKKITTKGITRALVEVTNTGRRRGTEVVQMYIRDRVSSVTRPIKELKGFRKISLEPGETKTVALEITPESLAFYDINLKFTVEPGEFEIMVGHSSRDTDLQKIVLTVTK